MIFMRVKTRDGFHLSPILCAPFLTYEQNIYWFNLKVRMNYSVLHRKGRHSGESRNPGKPFPGKQSSLLRNLVAF